jgi:hypothetical protein
MQVTREQLQAGIARRNNVLATPKGTTMRFVYDGKQRKGPVEGRKGTCLVVNTEEGYRSFNPNKMMNVEILTIE